MRTLLLLPILLMPFAPVQGGGDGSSLEVVGHKWTKSKQVVEKAVAQGTTPAPAMIPANKNFERNRRANDPAGVRDPNADTIDGRSAAMDKAVRESRAPKAEQVEGFAYKVRVRNDAAKAVEIVFWEYQFEEAADASNLARRQFLCGVQIKGGKEKEILAFSASGPNGAISVASLAKRTDNPYRERVVINRVEYADGSIWQRKDWNFAEVKSSVQRAVSTPWGAEMCRGL